MTYVIGSACVDIVDKSCMAECPADCIYEGDRAMYINPNECVDCGACRIACRVDAIYYETDLPDEELAFMADNAEFFSLTLPGRDEPLGAEARADVDRRVAEPDRVADQLRDRHQGVLPHLERQGRIPLHERAPLGQRALARVHDGGADVRGSGAWRTAVERRRGVGWLGLPSTLRTTGQWTVSAVRTGAATGAR